MSDITQLAAQIRAEPGKWKLLRDTTHDERSWPEDQSSESGGYMNSCTDCGRQFVGYRLRVVCRACRADAANPANLTALLDALDALMVDAERYQWFRRFWFDEQMVLPDGMCTASTFGELDAAIDTARKAQP